jgi:hypothetical protein
MNLESLLYQVASTLSLYEPKPEEHSLIHELLSQQLIMAVKEGKRKGYHITLKGVRWREARFGHRQSVEARR